MVAIINALTGELLIEFNDFEHRWYDDGKRRVNAWIKKHGYKFVRVHQTWTDIEIYVEEV